MVYFEQITRQNTDITGIKNCVSDPPYQILEFFVCECFQINKFQKEYMMIKGASYTPRQKFQSKLLSIK